MSFNLSIFICSKRKQHNEVPILTIHIYKVTWEVRLL